MITPPPDKTFPAQEEKRYCFTVHPEEAFSRLDKFLADRMREFGFSRETIKGLIKNGKVLLEGKTASSPKQPLLPGNALTVLAPGRQDRLRAEDGTLAILYRDSALAVINKPAGLTVHPAPGVPAGTLAHRLLAHFPELARQEGFRPGIVHRLDKDTSGLMLAALTDKSRLALAEQFARQEVFKEYLALVRGVPNRAEGVVDVPLGRHPAKKTRMAVVPHGRSAKSSWRVLYADPGQRFALVAVRIFSGRTHQVRVHMQHIGHPLWGDKLYTGGLSPLLPDAPRQMLHAWKLAFRHPFQEQIGFLPQGARKHDGKLSFLCPPPEDFSRHLRILARNMLRVVVTGSPGSGKSSLAALLKKQGLPCFSADAEVAAQYAPGRDGQSLLLSYFGDRFVPDAKSPVDKIALGEAMLRDDALRRQVEALLHPLVWSALEKFWREQENSGYSAAVAEIPLYLESGFRPGGKEPEYPHPLLVGVHAPFALREERLRKRGWSKDLIAKMETWQWAEEKKMRACDIVISNTGSMEDLRDKAAALDTELAAIQNVRIDQVLSVAEKLWNDEKITEI